MGAPDKVHLQLFLLVTVPMIIMGVFPRLFFGLQLWRVLLERR